MASIWDKLNEGENEEPKDAPKPAEEEKTNETPAAESETETPPAENTEENKGESAGEEGKTEETPKITLRERIIERGRSEYPDDYGEGDFDDDRYEGMVMRMLGDSDKNKGELGKLKDNNKKLFAIFEEHPDTMQVFDNLKSGMSLKKALSEVYGREYLDSEPDSEEEKAYMKSREEKAAAEKTIAENLKASESDRKKFYEEAGMSEEEIAAFEKAEDEFWDSYGNGKFDEKYYKMISNNLNREKDMKAAEEQGRVDGRNEKIVEEKFNDNSDGIPTNEGGSGKAPKNKKENEDEYDSDAAKMFGRIAKNSKSLFDN